MGDENKIYDDPTEKGSTPEEGQDFDDLLSNYLDSLSELEIGQLTNARVVEVKKDYVVVDVGDKAEGIVDKKEFADYRGNVTIGVGDTVEVVVKGRDSDSGHVIVSHRQAKQRQEWNRLVEAYEKGYPVHGYVVRALKNGVLVDAGVPCFLPASQLDVSRVEDLNQFVNQDIEAYVIDIDKGRRRGILSRRKLMEEQRKQKRQEVLGTLVEGETVSGKVKAVVDFGVFVELGGIDGLVPREEISWEKRVDMNEALKVGTTYKFKVIAIDRERERVTLSRKQLKPDPWLKIETDYPRELQIQATVTNLTNNCAYVLLEDGVEGRIHRDNLSWATSVRKPSDVLKKGDKVTAMVLDYDMDKRLLELGLKQLSADPWLEIEQKYPVGSRQKVKVVEVVPFGAFAQLDEVTKGLIHVSDMSYDRNFKDPKKLVKVGDEIEAVVLKIDLENRRINLGIKQLEEDPFEAFRREHPEGSAITGKIKSVTDFGAFVELAPRIEGLLHKSQWARERVDTLEGLAKPGEEVTVKILKIERDNQKISLSRRAFLAEEERREVDQYRQSPTDATTRLGSLLKNIKITPGQ